MAESSVEGQFETDPGANDLQKSSLSALLRWYLPGQSLPGPLVDDLRTILIPGYLPPSGAPPQAAFPAPPRTPVLEQPRMQANNGLQQPARGIFSHGIPDTMQNQREWPRPPNSPFHGLDSNP